MKNHNITELLPDSSRKTADFAAGFILKNPDYMQDLLHICFSDNAKVAMRASRIVYLILVQKKELVSPEFKNIIKKLPQLNNQSVIRNYLHLFINHTQYLDDEEKGILMAYCFKLMENNSYEIGPRVYAMQILAEISKKIPEIIPELYAAIEHELDHSKPAFISVGKKILKKLYPLQVRLKQKPI